MPHEKDKHLNLPKLEEEILAYWDGARIFEKSLAKRKGKKEFVFYEGPPSANGKPGIHHVLARVFKDIILRYRTMRGYYAPRRAGWDTHGLPIELGVEKRLGIKHKKEIEKLGIDLFNQKARESVWEFKEDWERLTKRIGYWLDMSHPYITYENGYIETLWWIVKEIHKRGFLAQNRKVTPYCPRCETALASHELGQPDVYRRVTDPSVYIKFKIKKPGSEYILVWTTTPWTLPANMLIAADPGLTYTKFKVGKEFVWSYNPPPETDASMEAVEKISGKKLIGLEYEPLYDVGREKLDVGSPNGGKTVNREPRTVGAYRVVPADFISTEDGTGFVHIAPAFGEDDFRLAGSLGYDLAKIPLTIDSEGKMSKGFPGAGKFIKDADRDISDDLAKRKLLYFASTVDHEYPFCWRCGTPLIYFARRAWFFEMSRLRRELSERNEAINWIPEHLKEGRFGEWIKEAKDWAISRERYWGAPLPLWRCEACEHVTVAGSLADLDLRAYFKNMFVLVRHTDAEHIAADTIASGPETGRRVSHLTKKGIRDAEKVAASFKGEKIGAIYASPYERTRVLAEAIKQATKAPLYFDDRLGELNAGIFNWRSVKEHKKFFANRLEEFTKTPPEGENLNEARKRIFAFAREINRKHRGEKIVIVSHGDPLWMLEAALAGVSNEEALKMRYIGLGERRNVAVHNWPQNEFGIVDIHRPFTDTVALACEACGEKSVRVPEVADVWFDSGAMPFAQNHFPFALPKNQKAKSGKGNPNIPAGVPYPADYICEAIDQTRGWFYTLLAVATLLGYEAPYKNVISLGLINDKFGRKMSKSKGNIVDPWMIAEKYGIDAVRWYFYSATPPGEPKNFDEEEIKKAYRRYHLIIWNSLTYWKTYGVKPKAKNQKSKVVHILDRWILSRLAETGALVAEHLDRYGVREASLELERFTDDLSRWYIRRSRRRFAASVKGAGASPDSQAASETLGHVILELTKLTAPFTPFFAEGLYREIGGKAGSVHLEDWTGGNEKSIDEKLIKGMAEVRRLSSLGLAKRAEAGIKVRQPLASASIKAAVIENAHELLEILKEELNVKKIIFDPEIGGEVALDNVITPELKEEGIVREIVRNVQELRQKAALEPKNKIALHLAFEGMLLGIARRNEKLIASETGAKEIIYKKSQKFDAEAETKLEGETVWIAVRKA